MPKRTRRHYFSYGGLLKVDVQHQELVNGMSRMTMPVSLFAWKTGAEIVLDCSS